MLVNHVTDTAGYNTASLYAFYQYHRIAAADRRGVICHPGSCLLHVRFESSR